MQHYYRGMDFLLDTGQDLELALYDHYSQLFNRTTDMVFYDTTNGTAPALQRLMTISLKHHSHR